VRYSRFEWLVLTVGGLTILATVASALSGRPMVEEAIAQLMLLAVLVAAVHWGRNAGSLAAVAAMLVYVAMRAPTLVADGITPDLLELIVARMVAYALVGIVGAEVFARVKYLLARIESPGNLDSDTGLYNQTYVARLVETALGVHERYKTPFSIALVSLSPALTSELKPARRRTLVRAVASHIRNDVRLVDDVGRLVDGTFVMLLPHTPKTGGEIAGGRVRQSVRELLGARDEAVILRVLAAPEDATELERLRSSIAAAPGSAA
jgi:GGDEF domain-containing protein